MRTTSRSDTRPATVRGGVSFSSILTGTIVAFGAIFLLSALLGGILTAAGIDATEVDPEEGTGISIGIGLILVQFLAFLWGGYTAGRMARGAGPVNGILVPVAALVVAALVAAAVAALGAVANLNLPFSTGRLPVEDSYVVNWGVGLGLAALLITLLAGLLGGVLGARWHSRLESGAATEVRERERVEDRGRAAPADDRHRTPSDEDRGGTPGATSTTARPATRDQPADTPKDADAEPPPPPPETRR